MAATESSSIDYQGDGDQHRTLKTIVRIAHRRVSFMTNDRSSNVDVFRQPERARQYLAM